MTWLLACAILFALLVCAELYAMRKMIESQIDEIERLRNSLRSMSDWIRGLVYEKEEREQDDHPQTN